MRIPTTDEMDHTTPEERYKLVAICLGCSEPHYFTGSRDRFSQKKDEVCKCGSKRFGELFSQRTFNLTAALRKAKQKSTRRR